MVKRLHAVQLLFFRIQPFNKEERERQTDRQTDRQTVRGRGKALSRTYIYLRTQQPTKRHKWLALLNCTDPIFKIQDLIPFTPFWGMEEDYKQTEQENKP